MIELLGIILIIVANAALLTVCITEIRKGFRESSERKRAARLRNYA